MRSSKNIRLTVVALTVAVATTISHATIDPSARLRAAIPTPSSRADAEVGHPEYMPMILQIDGDDTLEQLDAYGVIVYNSRGDLLLTSIPWENLWDVLSLDGVLNASASGDMSAMMDVARPFGRVDAVQQGSAPLPEGYDGSGVVVGFADIGFDANHVAFHGRVAQVWNFDTERAVVRAALTPEEVAAWQIDTDIEYHATHVAGILAGGYKGNPYYGVATGAEIVGTTSLLHDVGMLAGVEKVIEYAKSKDAPAVVNISMANHLGAHDGTSLLCQYLTRCADDAVICISAGNSGQFNIFATQDLNKADGCVMLNSLKTWNGFDVGGYAEIWSTTPQAFEFRFEVYDTVEKGMVYSTPWVTGEFDIVVSAENDPQWAKYFGGALYASGGVAGTNGCYMVAVAADTNTEEYAPDKPWSRYYTTLTTRRCADEASAPTVNYFADGIYVYLGNVSGQATRVSTAGSINDMVTAPGIISVGMAVSRVEAPDINGGVFTWGGEPGTISSYSAYSDNPYIPVLPTISAPGWYVVSAISNAYIDAHPQCEITCSNEIDGKTYYWGPTCGTSMSSPFMAGVAALWLQADPTLKVADIIDIATVTAQRQYSDISDPRWGAGGVDALAGMQEVLRRARIVSPVIETNLSVGPDRRLRVTGCKPDELRVCTASGVQIDPQASLQPGVYVVTTPDGHSRKISVP